VHDSLTVNNRIILAPKTINILTIFHAKKHVHKTKIMIDTLSNTSQLLSIL